MKTRTWEIVGACFVTAMVAYSLAFALGVHADARGSLRGDISDVRNVSPAPVPAPAPDSTSSPQAAPSPTPQPETSSDGGISNTTSGTVNSGDNEGGNVETGDESVDVQVVNEGPTNSNTVVSSSSGGQQAAPPPAPEPICDARSRECNDASGRGR